MAMVGALGALWLAATPLLAAPQDAVVGVASFERVGPDGQGVPDVGSRLAERLGASGVGRVLGPADLGAPVEAQPSVEQLGGWSREHGVTAVVVGRTTRLGNTLSVDARVLDAASGGQLGAPMVEEVNRPAEMGRAIDALAAQVVARLEEAPTPPVASAPVPRPAPAPAAAPKAGEAGADRAGSGTRGFDAGAPIAIKADELEVVSEGDRRKFIFHGNVEALQGTLTVQSTRLEAFYPPGGSQPERLVATGRVRLLQEGRVVTCKQATFFRADQRVECEGNARVDQACDRVRGDKITFFLDKEVMHVSGAADVQLRPDAPGCGTAQATGPGGSGR